jgi:hypothetical protein
MFNILFKAFDRLVSKLDAKAEQKFIKELIPRYASGNVLAQQGRFLVSKDIERRKKRILSYRFGVL